VDDDTLEVGIGADGAAVDTDWVDDEVSADDVDEGIGGGCAKYFSATDLNLSRYIATWYWPSSYESVPLLTISL
jgi:hypothetical protein